jgi:lysophospholipase L1-like esterase
MLTRRIVLANGVLASAALTAMPVAAETWEDQWNRRLREDWPGWRRYKENNAELISTNLQIDLVFIGDSITEGWMDKRPDFFGSGRVCRGVGGETTPQMLLRMIPDVCDLKPRAVHIMAGTNDIAGNTGAMTAKNTQDCYKAMFNIANAYDIHVIFGSIPPAAAFPWRAGLDTLAPIASLNKWLRDFAGKSGATYVDYHPALSDGRGGMKPAFATDGVHPTAAGYDAMAAVIEPMLRNILKFKRRSGRLKA